MGFTECGPYTLNVRNFTEYGVQYTMLLQILLLQIVLLQIVLLQIVLNMGFTFTLKL